MAIKELGTGVLKPSELGVEYNPTFDTSGIIDKFSILTIIRLDEVCKLSRLISVDKHVPEKIADSVLKILIIAPSDQIEMSIL